MDERANLQDLSVESLLGQAADEFSERLSRGETPDVEEYAQRYPQIAELIRQVFPALSVLKISPDSQSQPDGHLPEPSGTHCLGDYRILREIGRGGMGVVYEAEQVSLGRPVALKVLPFAAVLDPKHLKRFQNEARAAASLRHPNIVQVHSVGCERAVHFYAMDYVEGHTLAEVIRDLRRIEGLESESGERKAERGRGDEAVDSGVAESLASGQFAPPKRGSDPNAPTAAYAQETTPDVAEDTGREPQAAVSTERSTKSPAYFRSIAEIGVQVARALDHAHEQGVIHRDVKPSNVILDNQGKPWVTDFGLARIETDATLTISGDLLGTVRYMSPEQALAKRIVVDHRTDVYSLGVTLYELLTLQPAFTGQDREELLRQIAFEEPKAPRRLNKSVPAELETIVLKAMAKNPAERYDTAQELADDLERFLEDKPIRARRPSLVQRATKWSRRHKPLVVAACLLLALTTVGTTLSAILLAQEQQKTSDALDDVTEKSLALRVKNEELEKERRRANENLKKAREAVDRLFTKAAEDLVGEPHMEQIRRELLEDALEFYQGFMKQESDDPEIRLETAHAHARVADIYEILGDVPKTLEHRRSYNRIVRALHEDYPADPKYRELLARSHAKLTGPLRDTRLYDEADKHHNKSLEVWEQLARDFPAKPEYRKQVAAWHINGPESFWRGGPEEAMKLVRQGLALLDKLEAEFPNYPKDKRLRKNAHFTLGYFLMQQQRWDEGREHLRKAWAIKGKTPKFFIRTSFGVAFQGDLLEAEKSLRNWIPTQEKAYEQHPDAAAYAVNLCHSLRNLGFVLMATNRFDEAEVPARRVVEIRAKWAAEFPDDPVWRKDLAWAHYALANILFAAGKHQEAADAYRPAFKLFEELANEFPETTHEGHLAHTRITCPAEVFRDPQRSVAFFRRLLQRSPVDSGAWLGLGLAQYVAGDYRAAIESVNEYRSLSGAELPFPMDLLPAMAYWQLGDRRRGRELYDQHRKRVENNPTGQQFSIEYRTFRAEADEMFAATEAEEGREKPENESSAGRHDQEKSGATGESAEPKAESGSAGDRSPEPSIPGP